MTNIYDKYEIAIPIVLQFPYLGKKYLGKKPKAVDQTDKS